MGLTLLTARKRPNGMFFVRVKLDDADPDSPVREFTWSATPAGMTQAAWLTQIKAETKLLCLQELAERAAAADVTVGVALPGEGSAL